MTDGFHNFDPQTAKILNKLMDDDAEKQKMFIMRCYTDQELLRNYEALRNAYQLEDFKSKSAMREIVRYPHPIIQKFINHEMTKKYGPAWTKDKATFRKACVLEPLIEPWLVVPKKKI